MRRDVEAPPQYLHVLLQEPRERPEFPRRLVHERPDLIMDLPLQ